MLADNGRYGRKRTSGSSKRAIPRFCSATLNAVSSLVRLVSLLSVVMSTKSVRIVSMMVKNAIPSRQLGPKSFTIILLPLLNALNIRETFHTHNFNGLYTYLGITVPTHFNNVFLAPSTFRLISIVGDLMLSRLLVLPLNE